LKRKKREYPRKIMEINEYRERAIQIIDRYLSKEITAKEASDWALKKIISDEFEGLPPDITEAILCIFDLHDIDVPNASWVPGTDTFIKCKTELENNR